MGQQQSINDIRLFKRVHK